MDADRDVFAASVGAEGANVPIAHALWDQLREEAFVPDFRPSRDDSLFSVFGMGPEEVRDELIEPIITKLGLIPDRQTFSCVDFSLIGTPQDAQNLLARVAG
jgi:hypothetical protein